MLANVSSLSHSSMPMSNNTPQALEAIRDERILRVVWEGELVEFPFVFLRRQCACAHCVNEWTGEPILDPATVPEDLGLVKAEMVGNYALRIQWSDGHGSGLYTWDRLRELPVPCSPANETFTGWGRYEASLVR